MGGGGGVQNRYECKDQSKRLTNLVRGNWKKIYLLSLTAVLKEIFDEIFKQYLKLVMNLNPYSWKIRHNYNSGDIYSTSTNEPKSQQTPETKVIAIKKFYILCSLKYLDVNLCEYLFGSSFQKSETSLLLELLWNPPVLSTSHALYIPMTHICQPKASRVGRGLNWGSTPTKIKIIMYVEVIKKTVLFISN